MCRKYTRKGMSSNILLRSYSRVDGSEGLWPQLVRCAPFPSIALYLRNTIVSDPKIQMYNVWISEGYPDNGKTSKTNPDASGLENNRVKTIRR